MKKEKVEKSVNVCQDASMFGRMKEKSSTMEENYF
jgi:hypothetical protein